MTDRYVIRSPRDNDDPKRHDIEVAGPFADLASAEAFRVEWANRPDPLLDTYGGWPAEFYIIPDEVLEDPAEMRAEWAVDDAEELISG